jgi:hypothetical protein
MIVAFVAAAIAGPLGPFDDPVTDTGVWPEAECSASYPHALAELPDLPSLFRISDPSRTYGTELLLGVIVEATARVAASWPDSDPVLVGDLSLPRGGAFPPHRMHDAGRSADLGLFFGNGEQAPPGGFLAVTPEDLDVARTWALIEALLETGRVRFLLLDQGHIDRLVAWLRAERWLDDEEIERIFPDPSTPGLWAYEGIVRHAPDHRDHVHVELNCD